MPGGKSECDAVVLICAVVAFSLPLTLLVPGFSVWNFIPKVRVTRYHAVSVTSQWGYVNGAILFALIILFCFYLELRKRRLNDVVANVVSANERTDATMAAQVECQAAALRACVKLLDSSAEHYEQLVMLRNDQRHTRHRARVCLPPAIESSVVQ